MHDLSLGAPPAPTPPAPTPPLAPTPPPVPGPSEIAVEQELIEVPGVIIGKKVKGKGKCKGKATTVDEVGLDVEVNDSSSAVSNGRRTRRGRGQA